METVNHSSDFYKVFEELQILHEELKHVYDDLINKHNRDNLSHKILLILLARVCKYFSSYLILIKEGFGEPASNLIRSIFESSLWMRWILLDNSNAQKYFDLSKGEASRLASSNIGTGYFKIKNAPDPDAFKSLLEDESKNNKTPQWVDLAKETKMTLHYKLFYKPLSVMSHGTMMFLGERLVDKEIGPDPDDKNILPFFSLANNFTRDYMLVSKYWILEGKIREVPEIKA